MRIVVAMSGGVDSSTVAGLLHEAGHEVIGVTLQLYDHGAATGRKGACCAGQDIHDARRVADHLGIAHYVIDAEQRFADAVIADFADSYAAGETPVPCVRCNQTVKFTDLTALARGLGAERLATGHYVRRIDRAAGPELHRAADIARDQSWFLFATTREQLAFAMFPLGGMPDKAAVRAVAERLGLPVAAKPDSQDICFVASGHYADTVVRLRPDAGAPGEIVSRDGRVVGQHDGIARYTVGQGKRLGAAAIDQGDRQVVVALDPRSRRVVVGPRNAGTRVVRLREVNWLVQRPVEPLVCQVKLRAREAPQPATVRVAEWGAYVRLDAPALPAPGQACVFYDGERVLGGGFIHRADATAAVDAAGEAGLFPAPLGSDGGVAQR
jgi:tRNA-uridine 2-sulfurtransferase